MTTINNKQWNGEFKSSKDNFSVQSELQKQVVTHNVKQFFLRNLPICRICLETEDDSKGSAYLNPISNAIWIFLNLKEHRFPNMICTKCERKIVDFMILMEMCEESNNFIQQVSYELISDTGSKCFEASMNKTNLAVEAVIDISDSESIVTNDIVEENLIESLDVADGSLTSVEENPENVNTSEPTNENPAITLGLLNRKKKALTFKMINDKFSCIFCGKICDTKQSHSTHVRISHIRPHKCPVKDCTKAFGLPTMVRRHMNQMHSEGERKLVVNKIDGSKTEITMSRQESGKFECFYCGQKYNRQCYLEKHIKKVHEETNLKCNICGKMFNEMRLKVHMKIHKKLFECNECGRRFVDKFLLKKHLLAVHLGVKPYLCSQCGQNFGTAQKLRRHVIKVHENKSSKRCGNMPDDQKGYCKYCGLRFLDKTILIQHVKQHSLTLKCKICAKKFTSEVALGTHERTHKNVEYPFQCNNCNSRYETKALLKSHFTKIHINQQWLCTFCHKTLASSRALDVHEKLHEGIKEYQCFLCEKQFAATRRLKDHLIACHTQSRYQCTECLVRCISQRGFEAHLRREHPGMFELQPDMSVYFKQDPTYTQTMDYYHIWLRKLAKKRQEVNKNKQNIPVEVIELGSINDYSQTMPFFVKDEESIELISERSGLNSII